MHANKHKTRCEVYVKFSDFMRKPFKDKDEEAKVAVDPNNLKALFTKFF